MVRAWGSHPVLAQSIGVLGHAVDEFLEGDAMSCAGLLYPRIEGILRTFHRDSANSSKPTQPELAELAVSWKVANDSSLLMPARFKQYLDDVYFANFDLQSGIIPFSRNSVSHGVAKEHDYNMKAAVLGLLVVHQLFYFLPSERESSDGDESGGGSPAPTNMPSEAN